MRIHCEKCSAEYSVKDELLSDEPLGVQCPYCTHVQMVSRTLNSGAAGAPPELNAPSAFSNRPGQSSFTESVTSATGSGVSGLATLCQDCGAQLKDEFDKLVGLCDEHQGLRRSFLGIFQSTLAPAAPLPRNVSAVPRQSSSRVSIAPRREKPSRVGLRVALWLTIFGVVGAGLYYGQQNQTEVMALVNKWIRQKPPTTPAKPNPLAEWLGVWRMAFGRIEGRSADYLAKADKHYRADTWADYEKADDILKRALILDPKSPQAIGLFVENLAVWRGKSLSAQEVNTANAALSYAVPTPEDQIFIRRGQAALALTQGDWLGCREWGEQAVALAPKDARSRVLVASSYLEGNSKLAVEELKQALRLDSKMARAKRLLAYAYSREGRYASSLKVLKTRLADAPRDGALHMLSAEIRMELAQIEKSKDHLEKAVAGSGNLLEANIRLGETLLALGDSKEARKRFNTVVHGRGAFEAQKTEARIGKARASLLDGDYESAYKQAGVALAGAPKNTDALLVQAEAALLTKNASKAISLTEIVLETKPDNLLAISVNSLSQLELKLSKRAIPNIKRGLQSSPNDPRLHALLFAVYLATDETKASEKTLATLAQIDPNDNPARRAHLRLNFGKPVWKKLRGFLRPTSKKAQDIAGAYSVLAMMLYLDGDISGTSKALKIALKTKGSLLLARLYDAQLLFEAKKYDEAEEGARTMLDLDRSSAIGQLMLARVQKAKGELAEAKESYESALRTSPGLTIAKVELAAIALKAGQKPAAIKVLTEAFRMYPSLITTRRLLLDSGY